MNPRSAFWVVLLLGLVSCTEEIDVVVPSNQEYDLPAGAQPLPSRTRSAVEGVYRITRGNDIFGDFVVLKWSYVAKGLDTTHYLSMFCGREVTYFVVEGGINNGVLHFSGYWRRMTTTETGNVMLTIQPDSGGRNLLLPTPSVKKDSLVIAGVFNQGGSSQKRSIALQFLRPPFSARLFGIIAHRGGGRNSDLLPASENSVAMVLHAERFGATGIEIDVRLTSDGVPIIYHDENLNLRLNEKNGLVGPVEDYTYAQLQTFVRLIRGENIPTLRQMLDAVVNCTNLRVVWLDMKSARPSMPQVRVIQREYMIKAEAQAASGRRNQLAIVIGLPTEEKVEEYLQLSDRATAPALCELSLDDVRRTGAVAWAPRWTLGTQPAEVAQMHAEGRRVFTWTLDVPAYVSQFISTGDFDGILTNYPSIVAFFHYLRQP